MQSIHRAVLLPLLLVVGLACASSGAPAERRDYNTITRVELDQMEGQVTNLFDVVSRIRPRWFDVRGVQSLSGEGQIVVYQDQALLGDVSILRQLDLDFAVRMTRLDAAQATAQLPGLGSRKVAGAIVVFTR